MRWEGGWGLEPLAGEHVRGTQWPSQLRVLQERLGRCGLGALWALRSMA